MAWIIPKKLYHFAPDSEDWNLDLKEQGSRLAQSLMWRSKVSSSATFSRRLKREPWLQHLSSLMLSDSRSATFVERYTDSLVDIHAKDFQMPESERDATTTATSGTTSLTESATSSPTGASLKMSKDTLRWDSPQSSATWKAWVTKCRGDFSQRLNASIQISKDARSNGNESSYWPTCQARDYKESEGCSRSRDREGRKTGRGTNGILPLKVLEEEKSKREKNWPTIAAHESRLGYQKRKPGARGPNSQKSLTTIAVDEHFSGQPAQEKSNSDGSPPESAEFPTPRATDYKSSPNAEQNVRRHEAGIASLSETIHATERNWPSASVSGCTEGGLAKRLGANKKGFYAERENGTRYGAKLRDVVERMHGNTENWATPNAMDCLPPRTPEGVVKIATGQRKGRSKPSNLREQVDPQTVQIYKDVKDGKESVPLEKRSGLRLNPRWVETLMGLPVGFVAPEPVGDTDAINRTDELRLLGNGVVPQCAEKAFRILSEEISQYEILK